MASGSEILYQRINPRLVMSVSVLIMLLVPVAFLIQLIFFSVIKIGGKEPAVLPLRGEMISPLNLKPVQHYQEQIQARELFKPPVERPKPQVKQVTIEDLARNLELSGIIELDQREAIISDRRTRQKYYVNAGATIGELQVTAIESDKVVLSYKEETYELRMA